METVQIVDHHINIALLIVQAILTIEFTLLPILSGIGFYKQAKNLNLRILHRTLIGIFGFPIIGILAIFGILILGSLIFYQLLDLEFHFGNKEGTLALLLGYLLAFAITFIIMIQIYLRPKKKLAKTGDMIKDKIPQFGKTVENNNME